MKDKYIATSLTDFQLKAMVEIDLNKNGVLVVIKDNKSQFSFKEKEEKRL